MLSPPFRPDTRSIAANGWLILLSVRASSCFGSEPGRHGYLHELGIVRTDLEYPAHTLQRNRTDVCCFDYWHYGVPMCILALPLGNKLLSIDVGITHFGSVYLDPDRSSPLLLIGNELPPARQWILCTVCVRVEPAKVEEANASQDSHIWIKVGASASLPSLTIWNLRIRQNTSYAENAFVPTGYRGVPQALPQFPGEFAISRHVSEPCLVRITIIRLVIITAPGMLGCQSITPVFWI